ncbi:diphthamide biosynthesis protein 3 [Nematocida ausubeli]|nr:diphthamide biosynthesis protein 3 [Nematocida ausubeli]
MEEDYEEVDIDMMEYDRVNEVFTYPCPCGDRFEISFEELFNGEEIATCPSCSLVVKVNYLMEDLERMQRLLAGHERVSNIGYAI